MTGEKQGRAAYDGARPLAGKRIVVTRPRAQAAKLTSLLEAEGAVVVAVPVMRIVELPCPELDDALANLERYDLIAFTSANAVRVFFDRLEAARVPTEGTRGMLVATVGKATAEIAKQKGFQVKIEAGKGGALGLARSIADSLASASGVKVLWPRAFRAGEDFSLEMGSLGAEVEDFAIYDVAPEELAGDRLDGVKGADAVSFTSPTTVEFFTRAVEPDTREVVLRSSLAACIGETTAAAAAEHGYIDIITADENSVESLVEAMKKRFDARR